MVLDDRLSSQRLNESPVGWRSLGLGHRAVLPSGAGLDEGALQFEQQTETDRRRCDLPTNLQVAVGGKAVEVDVALDSGVRHAMPDELLGGGQESTDSGPARLRFDEEAPQKLGRLPLKEAPLCAPVGPGIGCSDGVAEQLVLCVHRDPAVGGLELEIGLQIELGRQLRKAPERLSAPSSVASAQRSHGLSVALLRSSELDAHTAPLVSGRRPVKLGSSRLSSSATRSFIRGEWSGS